MGLPGMAGRLRIGDQNPAPKALESFGVGHGSVRQRRVVHTHLFPVAGAHRRRSPARNNALAHFVWGRRGDGPGPPKENNAGQPPQHRHSRGRPSTGPQWHTHTKQHALAPRPSRQ